VSAFSVGFSTYKIGFDNSLGTKVTLFFELAKLFFKKMKKNI